jgi:DNA-binding IclR family transcriptional regulator
MNRLTSEPVASGARMAGINGNGPGAERHPGGAIAKAFTVLRILRKAAAPLPLTAIAAEAGLPPSSLHSILTQLLEQDAVCQHEDKRYDLGPALFYIGAAYARDSRVSRAVWSDLVTAANDLGVTAVLAVTWAEHHFILNTHRAGEFNIAVPQGGRVPLDAGSWGKAYYVWSGAQPPCELHRYTTASIVDPEQFAGELVSVRQNGYGTDRAEFADGVGGVSAAITSSAGYEGLVSFVAPLDRIEELAFAEVGRRVSAVACRASLTLGDRGRVPLFGLE